MQQKHKKLDDINDGIYYSIFYKFIFCCNLSTATTEAFHIKNHMHLSGLSKKKEERLKSFLSHVRLVPFAKDDRRKVYSFSMPS